MVPGETTNSSLGVPSADSPSVAPRPPGEPASIQSTRWGIVLTVKELKVFEGEEAALLAAVIAVLSKELKAISCAHTADVCRLGLAARTCSSG